MTFETNDNYSIRFEMKKHYSHSTTIMLCNYNVSDVKYSPMHCRFSINYNV